MFKFSRVLLLLINSLRGTGVYYRELFDQALLNVTLLLTHVAHDIKAVKDRDPAADSYLTVILNLKASMHQAHRLANCLWQQNREKKRFVGLHSK